MGLLIPVRFLHQLVARAKPTGVFGPPLIWGTRLGGMEIIMSIKARIEDAELLWQRGRKEGAWILALIAAAATSRKRYPKPIPDNKAFKSFIRDVLPTLVFGKSIESSTPNPNIIFDKTPVEDIVYEHLRCNLLHEATLSHQVAFSESKIMDGMVQGTIVVGSPNMIPGFWVLHLIKAVRDAPENFSDFTENT